MVSKELWNLDLFSELLGHVELTQDLWAVARTCRSLYHPATREVLRRGFLLAKAEHIAPFYRFVTSSGDRAPCLHHLDTDLSLRELEGQEEAETLAKIISHCQWIRQLSVDSAGMLAASESLRSAIRDSPNLRALSLVFSGGVATRDQMLVSMRSQNLVALDIDFTEDFLLDSGWDDDCNPCNISARYSSTLKILTLRNTRLRALDPSSGMGFSSLTTLELANCAIDNTAALMHTFPNLRQLITNPDLIEPDLLDYYEGDAASRVEPWKRLEYFKGSVELATNLRIPCPIQRWEISRTIMSSDSHEVDVLMTLMESMRLAQVSMDIDLEDEDDLERLIHEAGRFCLTHVSLRLNVESLTLNGMETLPVSTFVTFSHESRV